MTIVADTWYQFLRHSRYSLRQPVWLISNLTQPLIWLLLFGELFSSMTRMPGFPADNYLQFFAPGVLVMTALFGSAFSGMGILSDFKYGVVDKYLVTPVNRTSIVLARVMHAVVTAMVQSTVILAIALALGSTVTAGFLGAAAAIAVTGLLAAAFSAMSIGMAILLQREEPLIALLNFLTLPLMFLSVTMLPESLMPGWMAAAAQFNPVNWAVEAARSVMLSSFDVGLMGRSVGLLTGTAVVLIGLATRAFRVMPE